MKVRADIAEQLRAGHSAKRIIRDLHVDNKTVAKARRALDLPVHKSGRPAKQNTPEDLYRALTRPVEGGHLEWTGYHTVYGTPYVRWRKRSYTAYRIAFRLHHNREPIGQVRPGCDYPRCTEGSHLEDKPMRNQLHTQMNAIFGGAA